MFDSNKYNESCSFSEQIVSYIYNEMNEMENTNFTVHISQCVACSEELSAFGNVHSEIVDWKRGEFLPLQTPEIRIPYQTVKQESKKPLFAGIFELFSLSQVWMKMATAFALLAIVSGTAFFVFKGEPAENDLAQQVAPVSSPKPKPTQEVALPEPKIIEPENAPKQLNSNVPAKPIQATVRTNLNTKPKNSTAAVERTTVRTIPAKPKVKRQETVNLIQSDEDEDDSLRLSDLFDEISMK